VLATHGTQRSPSFPDTPTLKELGFDVSNETVHGIVAPAGTPPEIVKKLEEAFTKGAQTEEFKMVSDKLYLSPGFYDSKAWPEHLKQYWATEERLLKETELIKEPATQPY
jgi:tripartite-type tricarboxylate transporter receptor subunit TctC